MKQIKCFLVVVIYLIFTPCYRIPLALLLHSPTLISLCFTHYVAKRLTSQVGLLPYPMSVVCLFSSHTDWFSSFSRHSFVVSY